MMNEDEEMGKGEKLDKVSDGIGESERSAWSLMCCNKIGLLVCRWMGLFRRPQSSGQHRVAYRSGHELKPSLVPCPPKRFTLYFTVYYTVQSHPNTVI